MNETTKRCTICDKDKSSCEFKTRKLGGVNRRCNRCAAMLSKGMAKYYANNRQRLNQAGRERSRRYKLEVLKHYGSRCSCCGESRYEFLSIDHINGGGLRHRKEIGSNQAIIRWLINNGFPDGFRVLCFNCNLSRGCHGFCPHEAGILVAAV